MKLPVIITFECHHDSASYHMRLHAWPALLALGYNCYVDEDPGPNIQTKLHHLRKPPNDLTQARLQTNRLELALLNFLIANRCHYVAADVSIQQIIDYINKNCDLTVPKGCKLNDVKLFHLANVMEGRREEHRPFFELRNKKLSDAIFNASQTMQVISSIGYLHAQSVQTYLAKHYPDLPILSVYAFSDPAFDDFEVKIRSI